MSDTTTDTEQKAGETAPETKPPTKPTAKEESDGYGAAFKSMQAENSHLKGENSSLSKKLSEKDRRVTELEAMVNGYVRRDREGALVSKIKAERSDLSDIDIRGRLAIFAEENKLDRYAPEDKLDETVKTALELIGQTTPKPANSRQPAQGGGPNGAPQQPRQPNLSLDALFGIKH